MSPNIAFVAHLQHRKKGRDVAKWDTAPNPSKIMNWNFAEIRITTLQTKTKKSASMKNFFLVLFTFLLSGWKSIQIKVHGGHRLHEVTRVLKKNFKLEFLSNQNVGKCGELYFCSRDTCFSGTEQKICEKTHFYNTSLLMWNIYNI